MAAITAASLAALAIAAFANPRTRLHAIPLAIGSSAVSFGLVALWLVLARGFHSRPLLLVSFVLCLMVSMAVGGLVRRKVTWLLVAAAAASLAAQALGPLPGRMLARATGAELGARHKAVTVGSSLYTLDADVFLYHLCPDPKLACPAPRFGGAIAPLGDSQVIATGDGGLFVIDLADRKTLRSKALAYRVPLNADAFLGGSLDGGGILFRVMDLVVQPVGDRWRLFASHHYWHADRQCFVMRVSSLTVSRDELLGPEAVQSWRTEFETQPCLPVNEPPPHSKHKGQLFSGDESGGRMALIDSDTLLLTVGDHLFNGYDRTPTQAQDPASHYGKTLRIHLQTGKAEVFTLGHRNPQGLFKTVDGTLWLTEHGPRGGDELNRLIPGRNYGWPNVTYGTDYGSDTWPPNAVQGDHMGYERPIYSWVPSVATSNLIAIEGEGFPLWHGDLLVGSYSKRLWRVRLRDNRVAFAEPIDVSSLGSGRVRDLTEDKQGRLVLWIDGGTIAVISARPRSDRPTPGGIATPNSPEQAFAQRCGGCHAVDASSAPQSTGPSLRGVVGREIASHSEFAYSEALKATKGRWTEANLGRFLSDPQAFAPGTTMTTGTVTDEAERRTIIMFLESLH